MTHPSLIFTRERNHPNKTLFVMALMALGVLSIITIGSFQTSHFASHAVTAQTTVSSSDFSTPSAVVYDSGKNEIFVANFYSGSLVILNASTDQEITAICGWTGTYPNCSTTGGMGQGNLAYDPSNGLVFVSNYFTCSCVNLNNQEEAVAVINDSTNAAIAWFGEQCCPSGMAVDPAQNDLWLAGANHFSNTGGGIAIYSEGNFTLQQNNAPSMIIPCCENSQGPGQIVYDSNTREMFVTDGNGSVSVFSAVDYSVRDTIQIPGTNPAGMAFDPAQGEIFVSVGNLSAGLVVLSDSSNSVVATIRTAVPAPQTNHLVYDSRSGNILESNGASDVEVISSATNEYLGDVTVGPEPEGIDYAAAAGASFVANTENNSVSVITDSLLNNAPTTTSVSCAPEPTSIGSNATCTATVTGTSPSGTVNWSDNGTGYLWESSCTLSSGQCSVDYKPMYLDSLTTVVASYSGSLTNWGSSGSSILTPTKASTSTTIKCHSPFYLGSYDSCKVIVSGFGFPSGNVSLASNSVGNFSAGVTSCTLVEDSCAFSYEPLSLSALRINATYGGDASAFGSAGSISPAVSRGDAQLGLSCNQTILTANGETSCTASIGNGYYPTGLVSWSMTNGTGSFSPSTCALNGQFSCSVNYTAGSSGTLVINASYLGDSFNLGAQSQFSLLVNPLSSQILVNCAPWLSVPAGSPSNCTAAVSGFNPSDPMPTGSVFWSTNGTGYLSSRNCAISSGTCSISYTPASSDSAVEITAQYSGDSNYTWSAEQVQIFVPASNPIISTTTTTSETSSATSTSSQYSSSSTELTTTTTSTTNMISQNESTTTSESATNSNSGNGGGTNQTFQLPMEILIPSIAGIAAAGAYFVVRRRA